MEATQSNYNVVLGGSGDMGFIFPQLHPGFDAMFTIAKLIEMLTIQERSLTQVRSELPLVCHKYHSLRCPGKIKGSLMRYLVETESPEKLELIDGVKIVENHTDNWVLILPDAGEPLIHIYANSDNREWAESHLQIYRNKVQEFIIKQQIV